MRRSLSEAGSSPSGSMQFELLVLGEFDGFDEAISFLADLEMMDDAVGTFEVMVLIGCSDGRPGQLVTMLEALCVDNARSSGCTTVLGGCDSDDRPFDWSDIANRVSQIVTHVLYIAGGHRVDFTNFGSFLSGASNGYDVLAATMDGMYDQGSWCLVSSARQSCPRPMCTELLDFWLGLELSLPSKSSELLTNVTESVGGHDDHKELNFVNRTSWRQMQVEYFHYHRSRHFLFEYAICRGNVFVDLDAVNWNAALMTRDVFVAGFVPVRTEAAPANSSLEFELWHNKLNMKSLSMQWKAGGYTSLIVSHDSKRPIVDSTSSSGQHQECIYIAGGLDVLDRRSCLRTRSAGKTVARRMLSSGIDLQARETVATSTALAARGCVMPLLTSLPAVLHPQQLALLPATDLLAEREFKRCAVVGSSGHMLGRSFGAEIDAHDAVMRFNLHEASPSADLGGERLHSRANTLHAGTEANLCVA